VPLEKFRDFEKSFGDAIDECPNRGELLLEFEKVLSESIEYAEVLEMKFDNEKTKNKSKIITNLKGEVKELKLEQKRLE
jgi:hypothetical protein